MPNVHKARLDNELFRRNLVTSRSQAESWIKLGKVRVDGVVVSKPGHFVRVDAKITLEADAQYVSRAGLKLASVASIFKLDFRDKVVLDVGSSTGGFTDYALKNGASKVYAVDVGTDQLHRSLRGDKRIELHEKTDIRDFYTDAHIDIIVMDVSFISSREILPHLVEQLSYSETQFVIMVKPQFEAEKHEINKGVIKNDAMRRDILKRFEEWAKQYFTIIDKRDSDVAGAKGNKERFYLLKVARR
jgi:23S rRNA (cytidine1920-2'-O)/16S rRNA (cytidine1409-2'-O)-methyltransferase